MPLQSDVTISVTKFNPATNSEQSKQLNEGLIKILGGGPKWFEHGATKYRKMRWEGKSALPAPKVLPQGVNFTVPSRGRGRDIPCRVLYPSSRTTDTERKKCKGVFLHIHGGGWVLGDERSTDTQLQEYADFGDLAAISVGYRLAPEDPFPKGPEDCFDAGEYLFKNAEKEYGGPLRLIGGDSAGAHLTLLTTYHLLKTHHTSSPLLPGGGLLLHFGCYDISMLPSTLHFSKPLIINRPIIEQFGDAFLPNTTTEQRKDPNISPYYENLEVFRGRLPSAIFTCGTEDPLIDDTMVMGVEWLMSGGEAIVRIFQGAPHGFIRFPVEALKDAGEAMEDCKVFIQERMASE